MASHLNLNRLAIGVSLAALTIAATAPALAQQPAAAARSA